MSAELANWIVTGAAAIGVCVALWQLFQNAKIAGQTHAREAWMRYLEHGFQHPEYGSTELAMQTLGANDLQELWDNETQENERYWWFLDIMMESSQSLVTYFPQKEWQNTIKFNLRLHADAIRLMWEGEKQFYSEPLCEVVEEILAESRAQRLDRLPYPKYWGRVEHAPTVAKEDAEGAPGVGVGGAIGKHPD